MLPLPYSFPLGNVPLCPFQNQANLSPPFPPLAARMKGLPYHGPI